jgi:hypothetical protein
MTVECGQDNQVASLSHGCRADIARVLRSASRGRRSLASLGLTISVPRANVLDRFAPRDFASARALVLTVVERADHLKLSRMLTRRPE